MRWVLHNYNASIILHSSDSNTAHRQYFARFYDMQKKTAMRTLTDENGRQDVETLHLRHSHFTSHTHTHTHSHKHTHTHTNTHTHSHKHTHTHTHTNTHTTLVQAKSIQDTKMALRRHFSTQLSNTYDTSIEINSERNYLAISYKFSPPILYIQVGGSLLPVRQKMYTFVVCLTPYRLHRTRLHWGMHKSH